MAFVQFGSLANGTFFTRSTEEGLWRKVAEQESGAGGSWDKRLINTKPVRHNGEATFLQPETLVKPLTDEEKHKIRL
jgi:hypothetical protein